MANSSSNTTSFLLLGMVVAIVCGLAACVITFTGRIVFHMPLFTQDGLEVIALAFLVGAVIGALLACISALSTARENRERQRYWDRVNDARDEYPE